DVFASVLLSAVMNGKDMKESLTIATEFVSRCVLRTKRDHEYMNYSVNFEAELPSLMRALEL
ncbi:MAG: phosphomethylpyrimidine kinase, partial [Clostridia bacterium]|nr:phosphomethylpyrimidine kinase [Clostridia bacterium]